MFKDGLKTKYIAISYFFTEREGFKEGLKNKIYSNWLLFYSEEYQEGLKNTKI